MERSNLPDHEHSHDLRGNDSNRNEVNRSSLIIRLRGLPYSCNTSDITDFFNDCQISGGEEGIHIPLTFNGRPTGEAFVELADLDNYNKALDHNNEHMGKRYIEVFPSDKQELNYQIKKSCPPNGNEPIIKLRGLPFDCTREDIIEFFQGVQLVENGIQLIQQNDGRAAGEAYVELASRDSFDEAMKKHNGHIGHRYIELFQSSYEEMSKSTSYGYGNTSNYGPKYRPSPYDRPSMGRGGSRGARRVDRRAVPRANRGGYSRPSYEPYDDYFDTEYDYHYDDYGGYSYPSSGREMISYPSRNEMAPPRGPGPALHKVRMRGLPFSANEDEIYQFFYPTVPTSIRIKYDDRARASGEADIVFSTHAEAAGVMNKHKERMGHRYIELFLESRPETRAPSRIRGGSRNMGATYYNSGGYEDEQYHHSPTGAYYMPPAYSTNQMISGSGAYPKPLLGSGAYSMHPSDPYN